VLSAGVVERQPRYRGPIKREGLRTTPASHLTISLSQDADRRSPAWWPVCRDGEKKPARLGARTAAPISVIAEALLFQLG
jgi:hypothetical protein